MPKATQACFWIIGAANKSQAPAVAIDLHEANGELVGGTYTRSLQSASVNEARTLAQAYAAEHGVTDLTYDEDSTQFYAQA